MIGLGLSITQRAVLQMLRAEYSPAGLFAAGEQGAWYDPSDMSTMFQDPAGTTPVTGMEQPVGRILDKSGRGNHATQTTTAMRPVLQARYNLLTNTETLATQTVTVMATTQRLRFEGAGTITLSGAATGTYSAGSQTFTTTAGSLTLTVSGTVTRADLRAANDGIGLPEYQRVGAATSGSGSTAGNADYDTAGFPPYLRFFGVETWLSTASINFAGTDKMTVFAGARKFTDASFGVICELSANADANAGGFAFVASNTTGFYASVGSTGNRTIASQIPIPAAPASPLTSLMVVAYDRAQTTASEIQYKYNAAAFSSAGVGVQGTTATGNFGVFPLFIGRRNNATIPLNGRLYSLIVRGAQSTAQQISDTETWINQRTRAYA